MPPSSLPLRQIGGQRVSAGCSANSPAQFEHHDLNQYDDEYSNVTAVLPLHQHWMSADELQGPSELCIELCITLKVVLSCNELSRAAEIV